MIDISKEGYKLSSELFSFKDMRRGVIEHGKICYLEGYKKHADLFSNFLLNNGYFSKEELDKIREEFNEYLQKPYKINIEDIKKFLPEITYGFEKENWDLTKAQESIINSYAMLTEDCPILLIKKPRQKGVTSLLKTIAYIEAAQNNKKVWYLGYGSCYKPQVWEKAIEKLAKLKDCKNITYKQLHNNSQIEPSECCGKRYDLIIVDEMTAFKNPRFTLVNILPCLNKGGKIIVVGTIEHEENFPLDAQTISRYNENVNKFFDNPGVSTPYIMLIIDEND